MKSIEVKRREIKKGKLLKPVADLLNEYVRITPVKQIPFLESITKLNCYHQLLRQIHAMNSPAHSTLLFEILKSFIQCQSHRNIYKEHQHHLKS